MKSLPIIFTALFLFCSFFKDTRQCNCTKYQVNNECINKTRQIAIDSLKSDSLICRTIKEYNINKIFIIYEIKNNFKSALTIEIDDSCKIKNIWVRDTNKPLE
jgi:hypothetical protein